MSETSHTCRAVHAVVPEFKRVGFRLSLSPPVPDKFQVKTTEGSYRGLSRGVAVASALPIFSPRPQIVPDVIWDSQRFLCSVIQVGQVPIFVVTLYLYPNAPTSSDKYALNCKLVHWACQVVHSVAGPAVIAGDFNIAWSQFNCLQQLSCQGWVDAHQAASRLFDTPLDPTCKGATRHTFMLVAPALVPYIRGASVEELYDLDAHSVLKIGLDVPSYNPVVYKWLLPKALDTLLVDKQQIAGFVPSDRDVRPFQQAVAAGDMSLAFTQWSALAEDAILSAATFEDGQPIDSGRFKGRGSLTAPVKRVLAAPRVRQGRATDFAVSVPSTKLPVRRAQRQARRLQSLVRLLRKHGQDSVTNEIVLLQSAILTAPGFGRSFQVWLTSHGMPPFQLQLETLVSIYEFVSGYAQKLATQAWRQRRTEFVHALEQNWDSQGGSMAFRLLRDQALPPVLDLTISKEVQLSPQRWSPFGKAWIQVRNIQDFPLGSVLSSGDLQVTVIDSSPQHLQLSQPVSRRQASRLSRSFVSADPAEWAPVFLQHWEHFWISSDPVVHEDLGPILQSCPQVPTSHLPPLSFEDWQLAVRSAKKKTMRGVDGWTPTELAWLPQSVVELLFSLFEAISTSGSWPVQLTTWLLVLLRKSSVPSPSWALIRPISVAGLVYRIWSRMQTRRFMQHARLLAVPLVSPSLSTRAIWTFVSDLIAKRVSQGRPLSGFVLDIVKCFNVLDRGALRLFLDRLGFDPGVTRMWLSALAQLQRNVLIGGYAFGASTSTTGIPEGDPLSVIGMFAFAFVFYRHVLTAQPAVVTATYADNWECIAGSLVQLLQALQAAEQFLTLCKLPVAPDKCWFWAIRPKDRKRLRATVFMGANVPVKLSARDLGADVAYSFKAAAQVRNSRVVSGHKRLLRLAGMPIPVWRRTRLLLSSVFPHTLHAAESTFVPKTTLQRLRTKVSKGLGLAAKGSSPWLTCLLGTYQCVDPEFVLLIGRVRLFRQVIQELPLLRDLFFGRLDDTGRYKGPTRHLVDSLRKFGWYSLGPGLFQDDHGRLFHLCLTSLPHVISLLLSSWTEWVAAQLRHRKYLEDLWSIDPYLSRQVSHLQPGERAVLRVQQTGAFYSGEFTKHFSAESAGICRFCQQPDDRLHRMETCPKSAQWRALFPGLFVAWPALPVHVRAFGLWPENRLQRAWQAALDSIPLPCVTRVSVQEPAVLFSDGSCLFPKVPLLRLAGGAAIQALSDGSFRVVWHGPLPLSQQSAFRAELLSGSVALRSFTKVKLFSDCKSFVVIATRLISDRLAGRPSLLPRANRDLWAYFSESLDGLDLASSSVAWIRSHRDYTKLQGFDRVTAWFNHWADRAADQVVQSLAQDLLYQDFSCEYLKSLQQARDLASFQAGIGLIFGNEPDAPVQATPLIIDAVTHEGIPVVAAFCPEVSAALPSLRFGDLLANWIVSLRFFSVTRVVPLGELCDTSWVELFWCFLADVGVLPPFRRFGEWVWAQDDNSLLFVLPPFLVLFRSWKLHLDILLRSGRLSMPWEGLVPKVASLGTLGARFSAGGFVGRASVAHSLVQGFCLQLCAAPRLSALRLPASVN